MLPTLHTSLLHSDLCQDHLQLSVHRYYCSHNLEHCFHGGKSVCGIHGRHIPRATQQSHYISAFLCSECVSHLAVRIFPWYSGVICHCQRYWLWCVLQPFHYGSGCRLRSRKHHGCAAHGMDCLVLWFLFCKFWNTKLNSWLALTFQGTPIASGLYSLSNTETIAAYRPAAYYAGAMSLAGMILIVWLRLRKTKNILERI